MEVTDNAILMHNIFNVTFVEAAKKLSTLFRNIEFFFDMLT